jgi:hypothetical protein
MTTWEYMVIDWELPLARLMDEDNEYCFCRAGEPFEPLAGLSRKEAEEAFNRLGVDGWELVHVYEYRKFYFKRPLTS